MYLHVPDLVYLFIMIQVIKQTTLLQSRHDTIAVVDMDKVTKNSTPRKQVAISALSSVGYIARSRAILEGERRFCGNHNRGYAWFPRHNDQDGKDFYASRFEDGRRRPRQQECLHGGEKGPEGDLCPARSPMPEIRSFGSCKGEREGV